jgi:hypothetical protein
VTNTERLIRKHLPGNANTKARKVLRDIVEGNDYAGHAAELRALASNPHAIIPAVACNALADEMDRLAKDQARAKATNAEITKAIKDGCPCCGAVIRRNFRHSSWTVCRES